MARPTKSPNGSASMVLQMRVPKGLHDELRVEAETSGRSIADQAMRRLIRREDDVGQMIGLAISTVESRLGGRKWAEDEVVKAECRAAARVIIDLMFGVVDETSDDKIDELIEHGSREDMARRIETLSTAIEVYDYSSGKGIPD